MSTPERQCIELLTATIEDLMPQMGKVVLQDYSKLNRGLQLSAELLKQPVTPQGTEARVCEDIANRQRMGIAKYGSTVESNPAPLQAWLQHAYEETLDQAIYLRRAMEELDKILSK